MITTSVRVALEALEGVVDLRRDEVSKGHTSRQRSCPPALLLDVLPLHAAHIVDAEAVVHGAVVLIDHASVSRALAAAVGRDMPRLAALMARPLAQRQPGLLAVLLAMVSAAAVRAPRWSSARGCSRIAARPARGCRIAWEVLPTGFEAVFPHYGAKFRLELAPAAAR